MASPDKGVVIDVDTESDIRRNDMSQEDCLEEQERVAGELLWCALKGVQLERRDGESITRCRIMGVRHALANGARVTDEMMVYAVGCNLCEIVKQFLAVRGNPNAVPVDEFGNLGHGTLLAFAVVRGSLPIVDLLLSGGAAADGHLADCVTPLMWAAYRNRAGCVVSLLRAGADVNAVDSYGRSPVFLAAADAGCTVMKVLLNAGGDANVADCTGTTPLMQTSRYGDRYWITDEPRRTVAELLLHAGADPNRADRHGNTALLIATEQNMTQLDADDNLEEMNLHIGLLLDAGACVNAVGWNSTTPLINVCRSMTHKGECVVELLVDAGAKLEDVEFEGNSALMVAAGCNTAKVVHTLISRGAEINNQNIYGATALVLAASDNDPDVVRQLLDAGAIVDMEDCTGATALLATFTYAEDHFVGRESRRIIADMLLEAGASVNKADRDGNTALLLAADHYMSEMMTEHHGEEMLLQLTTFLEAGADVNAVGGGGSTALINVCRTQTHRATEMVNLLLDHGANVNAADDSGMTPLLSVCQWAQWNSDRVAATLLSRGADIGRQNDDGHSAAELLDLYEDAAQELAIVLMRGGANFAGIDLDAHEMLKDAWQQCCEMRLQLRHICREKVRSCMMVKQPGQHIGEMADQVGLPHILSGYVGNVERYDLGSELWKVA